MTDRISIIAKRSLSVLICLWITFMPPIVLGEALREQLTQEHSPAAVLCAFVLMPTMLLWLIIMPLMTGLKQELCGLISAIQKQ